MRWLAWWMAAVLVLAVSARADLTITSVAQTAFGQVDNARMTTYIKGDKLRMESTLVSLGGRSPKAGPPAISMAVIEDLGTGKTVLLMPSRKMKTDMSEPATQPSAGKLSPTSQPNAFAATGKTDTVGGYAVAEYSAVDAGYSISVWTTADYPHADQIRPQMFAWLAASRQAPEAAQQIPGIPLKIVMRSLAQAGVPAKDVITITVTSISQNPVSDDEFRVPAGYDEIPQGDGGR